MTSTVMGATRIPLSMPLGIAITLALFWVLQQFISGPVLVGPRVIDVPDFTPRLRPPVESPIVRPTRPEPPVGKGLPGGPTVVAVKPSPPTGERLPRGAATPNFRPDTEATGRMPTDHDAFVRVAPPPEYPAREISGGIEGWVLIEFTVTPSGSVANAFVVDSEPSGTFDKAVLRAVAGWKYMPRVEDGVAVERPGMRAVLKFELAEE